MAFERSAETARDEYNRKVRIACRAFNCHCALYKRMGDLGFWNLYKYLSHKFIRWFSALWVLLGVPAVIGCISVATSWYAGFFVFALVLILSIGMSFASKQGVPALGKIWQIWCGFFATLHGVMKALLGHKYHCLLYTSPSPRDQRGSRMPSSA